MSNVNKLVAHKVAIDAIPSGGGVAAGIAFLSDKARIVSSFRVASEWVRAAIQAVREAVDPNPFRDVSDEVIAGEILRRIEERKSGQQTARSQGLS